MGLDSFQECKIHLDYVFCRGWLLAIPRLFTHIGHQLRYGRCVRLRSLICCGVGCSGALTPLACRASCCSSSSMSSWSLYSAFSSKLVEPVHSLLVLFPSIVQLSSWTVAPSSCVSVGTIQDRLFGRRSGGCPHWVHLLFVLACARCRVVERALVSRNGLLGSSTAMLVALPPSVVGSQGVALVLGC